MKRIASALAKCWLLILAASAAAGVSQAFSSQVSTSPLPLPSFEHLGWTAADFDGDSQPDVAITEAKGRNSYVLSVRLSTNLEIGSRSQQPDLPVHSSSTLGLHITQRDVDGDNDLDIVITVGIARQPIAVWINEGKGRFVESELTALPAWDWPEGCSSIPQIPPNSAQALLSENRRYWFALAPVGGSVQHLRCFATLQLGRRNLPICSRPANQQSARAPPRRLSVLS